MNQMISVMTEEERLEAGYSGRNVLTDKQISELREEYKGGETQSKLGLKYKVCPQTVRNYLQKANLIPKPGMGRTSPNKMSKAGPIPPIGLVNPIPTRKQAQSAETPLLSGDSILNEGQKLSLKDNLLWAIQSAGLKLRTGEEPRSCPNDQAYFLYIQATSQPKDFMGKFTQVLNKVLDDSAEKELKKQTKMALMDIDEQLKMLAEEDEEPDDSLLDSEEALPAAIVFSKETEK